MKPQRLTIGIVTALAVAVILAIALPLAAQAQNAATVNWTLHNLDLAGSRFSPMTQINRTNVKALAPRWLFQHGVIDGVSNQTTPVVVDGRMYVTDSRGSVYALDAADGHLLWTYDVTNLIGGGAREGYVFRNRGVVYANGVVYAAAGSFLFALDAATGKPLPGFGNNGQASVILDVLRERYPDVKTAISMGYWFTTAPQYYNGVLYIGSTRSESHIPGGHVLAVDAKTGKVLWVFNTVPQDEKDQGWELAGPTWVGGERNGGGIWETPAIDPALGLVYVAVGNPYGDSKKRAGTNLFSDSIVALTLNNGTLKWHYQQTHHDVWDYDSGGPPTLFDMQVGGRTVKALAQASKNGYLYILDRETGSAGPSDQGDAGACRRSSGRARMADAADSVHGGGEADGAGLLRSCRSRSRPRIWRRTRSCRTSRRHGRTSCWRLAQAAAPTTVRLRTARRPVCSTSTPSTRLSTPDPAAARRATSPRTIPTTGELKWRQIFEGFGQAGSVVTAGGVVFVGSGSNIAGYFFAFDAKTGDPLWKFNTGAGVFSSPSVYMVNGEEFVAVASGGGDRGRRGGDLILSFALPKP